MARRSTRTTCALLLLAALGVVAWTGAFAAPPTGPCSAPCFQAARSEFRACMSSANGVFADALDGCLEREHECVDACREQRQECRDGTGVGAGLVACAVESAAEKARCRDRFPIGSRLRARCIDKAAVEEFRCRNEVRRRFVQALRTCAEAFDPCTSGCGPGAPPGGADTCRAEGKSALRSALVTCKQTFVVTARACFGKDLSCVQDCADARMVCGAPTQSALDAALAGCTADEAAALSACRAANPGGGPALDQCITTAQANAFTCREAALDASAPGFAPCAEQYLGCVKVCPPA